MQIKLSPAAQRAIAQKHSRPLKTALMQPKPLRAIPYTPDNKGLCGCESLGDLALYWRRHGLMVSDRAILRQCKRILKGDA